MPRITVKPVHVINKTTQMMDLDLSRRMTITHWQMERYPASYEANLGYMQTLVNRENCYHTILQEPRRLKVGWIDIPTLPLTISLELLFAIREFLERASGR